VKTYDLRSAPIPVAQRDGYRSRDLKVHSGAWKLMPNQPDKPLGRRQFITDHTPTCQILDIRFADDEFSQWQAQVAGKNLEAALYSPLDTEFKKPLIRGSLQKSQVVLQIINRDLREEDDLLGVHLKPYTEAVISKTEVFTDYRLRIEAGDSVLKDIPIVFAARKDRPATAKRQELRGGGITVPGYVLMKVEPEVKKESPLDKYKSVNLRYRLRMKYRVPEDRRDPDRIRHLLFKDEWIARGAFDGNIFTGKLLSLSKRTGTVRFKVDPETMALSDFQLEAQWVRSGQAECKLQIQSAGSRTLENVTYPGRPEHPEVSLEKEEVCSVVEFSYDEKNLKPKAVEKVIVGFDCEAHRSSLYGGRPEEAYFVLGIK